MTELSDEEKEAEGVARIEAERRIAVAKQHLRLLQDLENTPGYRLFHSQLLGEIEQAFNTMERENDPVALAKIVGAYCALQRTTRTVSEKIQELTQLLNNPEE